MFRRAAALLVVLSAAAAAHAAPDDAASDLRAADPARRLAALRALDRAPDAEVAALGRSGVQRLARLLERDDDPAIRAAAAPVLARAAGEDAVPALIAAVRRERDPEAAAALPAAFAHVPAAAGRRPLSELAFGADDPRVGCLAAEALGHLPELGGKGDLVALVRSVPHWAVLAGACLGLGEVRDPAAVDELVPRLRHPDAAVRAAARDGLVRLTGGDRGIEPRAWEDWWAAAREGWHFPDRAGDPSPGADTMGGDARTTDRGGDRPTYARFFGIPLEGRRAAFVVDYSQSMWGARRAKAESELIDAVKGLSSATTFAVVLFNEKVWWFGTGPLPARPQQKLDLERYLPEQETKSYTAIYDALEQALGLLGSGPAARDPAPGLDVVVVLSDGVPNRGRLRDTDRILEAVGALNGGRARIHSVSLGDEELDLLPALAAQNRGRHIRHPFPK